MSRSSAVRIIHAETPDDMRTARSLFKEYAAWLAIDLSFPNFEEELAHLPGEYAPPDGRLILALVGGEVIAPYRYNHDSNAVFMRLPLE